jgi:poly(3-hydroxybutyrate) depolymerase
MRRRLLVLAALFALVLGLLPGGAVADDSGTHHATDSLPTVTSGALPGPAVLYDDPPEAPMLDSQDGERFRAEVLRISGAEAYVEGEYLYSDFLYDDTGDGSASYPDSPDAYADLVEFRISDLGDEVAYRLTFNTLTAPDQTIAAIAFDTDLDPATGTDQLPGDPGAPFPGTDEVITVWGSGATHTAYYDEVTETPDLEVAADTDANQLTVTVPREVSDPEGVWRTTVATGVHDTDDEGSWRPYDSDGNAIYNVAFRFDEPITSSATAPDSAQSDALSDGEPTRFAHEIDFGLLATRDTVLPEVTGTQVRFFPSRLDLGEGRGSGFPEFLGQLQPYSLYVPSDYDPSEPAGFTFNLHSLTASYWQYNGSEGVQQLGEERGHLVATPHARGTDGWYQREAEFDVFEVWNDVARHFALDPDRASSAGYSMGGYGTYRLATRYPDLFGAAMTTVAPPGDGIWVPPAPPFGGATGGEHTLTNVWLENARNVPFLNVVAAADELVPYAGTTAHNTGAGALGHGLVADVRRELAAQEEGLTGVTDPLGEATATLHEVDGAVGFQSFEELGYRYRYRTYPTAEHLTLAALSYDVPGAAEFLGDAEVDRDPAHVTFAAVPEADHEELDLVADHAYWVSDIMLADEDAGTPAKGVVDAFSHGHGTAHPEPARHADAGVGPVVLAWQEIGIDWTEPEEAEPANLLEVSLDNAARATIDVPRAALDPEQELTVEVDGDTEALLTLDGDFPVDTEVLRDGEVVAEAGPDGAELPVVAGEQTFTLVPGEIDEDPDDGDDVPGQEGRDTADERAGDRGQHGRDRAGGTAGGSGDGDVTASGVAGQLAGSAAGDPTLTVPALAVALLLVAAGAVALGGRRPGPPGEAADPEPQRPGSWRARASRSTTVASSVWSKSRYHWPTAVKDRGAWRQMTSSASAASACTLAGAPTGTASSRRRGWWGRRARSAARAVTPVASPSSTTTTSRPVSSGSGRSPR